MTEQLLKNDILAEEKLIYSQFFLHYVTSRLSQMPSRIVDIADIRLPTNSVLHSVDRLLEPDTHQITPDLEAPFIKNESFIIQMKFIMEIPSSEDPAFPVTEKYRFQSARMSSQINNFFQHHMSVRPIRSSPQKVLAQSNNLVVFNYNPLRSVILTGGLRNADYRRFELLFRAMLHQVVQIDNRHQIIHIPLSNHIYTQRQITPCFQKLNVSTLRIHDDPSYFFLIHLLGLYADAETSLFRLIDRPLLDRITVILTCQDKAVLYNLGDLLAIAKNNAFYRNVLRHINTLKMAASELTADLPSTLTDDQFDDITGKMERDPEKTPMHASPSSTSSPITISTPTISTPQTTSSTRLIDSAQDRLQEKQSIKTETPSSHSDVNPNKSAIKPPTQNTLMDVRSEPEHQSTNYGTYLISAAINNAAQNQALTDMQRQRIPALLDRHMAVPLDGRSIGDWLTAPPPPPINPADGLEHLKDQLADPSMAAASIHHMDQHYLTHMMSRHIAATISSFATQGMFVSHVEQHIERTSLNRVQHYKVSLVDATGRHHSIGFRLPEVSRDGTMLVNGVVCRMTKQPVNLPICKISPTRVNLASAYNKTLVERSTYKANNFTNYIHGYIENLRHEGALIASFGTNVGVGKLPYEYTCVANGYSRLETPGMVLTFDHAGRFDVAANAPAMEVVTADDTHATAVRYATISELLARSREKDNGVYTGYLHENGKVTGQLFMDMDNIITIVRGRMNDDTGADTRAYERTTLIQLLQQQTVKFNVVPPKMLTEWTELKILDRSFPLVFILGFRLGLTDILQRIGLKYRVVPVGKRVSLGVTEIAVRFSDCAIVFDRYPLSASLIASGLTRYDTRQYTMVDFDNPDTYYKLLVDSDISTNYLRGITSFFELFIDPITYDVLQRMGEPVMVPELLLRASEMLTDNHALEASAMANHRLRGYERFSALLYREVAMTYARYSQANNQRKGFSINPDAVFMSVISDPTFSAVDLINPVHDLKCQASITYAGAGGRTAQSFVVNDRRYPKDGVGVLSEATVDSGKVAINAYTSVNPLLANELGMFMPVTDVTTLTPAQVLSPTSCLLPGVTQDEGRRAVMASIQLTHHVSSMVSEVNRIRTGFEKVLPHISSEVFACAAKEDGVVESVDEKLGLIKIRHNPKPRETAGTVHIAVSKSTFADHIRTGKPIYIIRAGSTAKQYVVGTVLTVSDHSFNVRVGEVLRFKDLDQIPGVDRMDHTARSHLVSKLNLRQEEFVLYIRLDPVSIMEDPVVEVYSFGESFTSVSGFHLRQNVHANVSVGDAVKKGDIIAYNAGFFAPEPGSKQVAWKQGVGAWVAFMELAGTLEDSSVISPDFGKKMTMAPAHVRRITLDKKTIIHQIVNVDDYVETTDLLCVMEDSDLLAGTITEDQEDLAFLTELNRKAPRAKYHGRVAEVNVLYACDPLTMHPSLQTVLKKLLAPKVAKAQAVKDTARPDLHLMPQRIPAGTKYGGIEFDEGTVVLEFTITEDLDAGQGDKIVINSANKSVIGSVMEKAPETESGIPLDILFSGSSAYNRIITSIYVVGIGNRALIAAENAAVNAYFD